MKLGSESHPGSQELGYPSIESTTTLPSQEDESDVEKERKLELIRIFVSHKIGKPLERDQASHEKKVERYSKKVYYHAITEGLEIPDQFDASKIDTDTDRLMLITIGDLRKVGMATNKEAILEMIGDIIENHKYNIHLNYDDPSQREQISRAIIIANLIDTEIAMGWNDDETADPFVEGSDAHNSIHELVGGIINEFSLGDVKTAVLNSSDILNILQVSGIDVSEDWFSCDENIRQQIIESIQHHAEGDPFAVVEITEDGPVIKFKEIEN